MTLDEDFDIPDTGAVFTFGKSRFAENTPSKFWIKNDIIRKVVCGDEHTAIVTGSGRVFTIGSNNYGQLGLGHRNAVARPACVKALKPQRVIQVACGRAHTVAATEIGSIFTWGSNDEGQLGTRNYEDFDSPTEICKLSSVPIQLAAGSSHSIVLTDRGELLVWGSNKAGQLGCEEDVLLNPIKLVLPQKIATVACGYYHTLVISDLGFLFGWGEKDHGKLGLSEDQLICHKRPQLIQLEEKVVMVAGGSSHSVVLTESGTLLSCGFGTSGQLGQGVVVVEQGTFQPLEDVQDKRFIYISTGDNHSAAISDDGYVYTWGCGRHGKLCLGEHNFSTHFSPSLVTRLEHLVAVQVDCGGCHTMILGYRRSDIEPRSTPWIREGMPRRLSNNFVHPFNGLSKSSLLKEPVHATPPSELQMNSAGEPVNQGEPQNGSYHDENVLHEEEEEENENYDSNVTEAMNPKVRKFAMFWNSLLKRKVSATTPIDYPVEDSATLSSESEEENEVKPPKYDVFQSHEKDGVGGKSFLISGCLGRYGTKDPTPDSRSDVVEPIEIESKVSGTDEVKTSKLCAIL